MCDSTHVLIPVAVLQSESISDALVDLFSSVDITLLGYHELPDQTATDQARTQYNNRIQRRLASYATLFEAAEGSVTTRSAFTHDAQTTIERIAIETDVTAILLPNPAPEINNLLLPIRGGTNLNQLTTTTATVVDGTDAGVILFHAARSEPAAAEGQALLATAAEKLQDAGVDAERITSRTAVTPRPVAAIASAADDAELVVLGERKPSLVDRIFGEIPDRVAQATDSPVLVVRKPLAEAEAGGEYE